MTKTTKTLTVTTMKTKYKNLIEFKITKIIKNVNDTKITAHIPNIWEIQWLK